MKMHFNEKDFDQYVDFIGQQESQDLRPPTDFLDAVVKLAEFGDQQAGDSLLWNDAPDIFRLRPSELTIWAGEKFIIGYGNGLADEN